MSEPAPRVFVVDDDELFRCAVRDVLLTLGYEVCGDAGSGADALRWIPLLRPDVILMDLCLGYGPTGVEVAEELRGAIDVPVVFVTGAVHGALRERAARTESFGYVSKPFHPQALAASLELAIVRHAAAARLREANLRVHEANQKLRESEVRFRQVVERISDAVVVADRDGRVTFANDRFLSLLGLHRAELSHFGLEDWAGPQWRAALRDCTGGAASGPVAFEYQGLRNNGPVRAACWIEGQAVAVRDAAGELVGTQSVLRDVSERRRVEAAARCSADLLRAVVDGAPVAMLALDREGRITVAAGQVFEKLGVQPSALVGASALERYRDVAGFEQVFRRALFGEEATLALELGSLCVEALFAPSHDAGGEITGVVVVGLDVSEKKRVEKKLLESQEHYRSLFDEALEGVFRVRIDGMIVSVNPAFARMTGYALPEELRGRKIQDLYADPGDRGRIQEAHEGQEVIEGVEARWKKKNGEPLTVELSGRVLRDANGQATHHQGFVRDVTLARAQAARERALLEHKEQLELVLAGTRLGFWDWNPKADAVAFSERWAEILGYASSELEPSRMAWEARLHPDDLPGCQEAVRAHLEGKTAFYEHVHRLRHKDGRWVYVLDRGKVFERDAAGQATRFCGTHCDITAEKRAEEALTSANRAKAHFLANMSHELRTPLHAVLGLSDALLAGAHGGLTQKQQRSLRTIHHSGKHLLELINDVIDSARLEAGTLALAVRDSALAPLVGACVSMVRDLASAKEQRLSVELCAEDGVVRADPRRLKQVLLNLLTNAIKFSPRGAAIVVGSSRAPGRLELWVSNTGAVIAPRDRERIFQPFVTTDQSLAREHAGAGLGLSLVKSIVELHRGSVRVESEPGPLTRFVVSLPEAPFAAHERSSGLNEAGELGVAAS